MQTEPEDENFRRIMSGLAEVDDILEGKAEPARVYSPEPPPPPPPPRDALDDGWRWADLIPAGLFLVGLLALALAVKSCT